MTLEQHAAAISAAIHAAAADGFYLSSDEDSEPLEYLDLNNRFGLSGMDRYISMKLPVIDVDY